MTAPAQAVRGTAAPRTEPGDHRSWPDGRQDPGPRPATDAGPPTAALGGTSARLLAGPTTRESLAAHLDRLGPLPVWEPGAGDLLDTIDRAGLTGRGGGHFPLATKIATARRAGGVPVVVVNTTESEPASAKDHHLLAYRPHLVIDGALAAAAASGAGTVILAGHEGSAGLVSLQEALRERGGPSKHTPSSPQVEIATVPDRYIAGESSALVSYLGGGPALPSPRGRPTAECGLDGRPTVVSNAETVAHLALLARRGDRWFREAGGPSSPGSLLVTLAGDVARPGAVAEVLRPLTVAEALERHGGIGDRWQAVLLGGYGGTWVGRDQAGAVLIQGGRVRPPTPSIGCGLIAVIGEERCGLAEAARVLDWLVAQRGGQCGACSFGLPLIAEQMAALAEGRSGPRRTHRRIASLAHSVAGRGLCHLPDGAIAMAESALEVFADEARLHRRGRCRAGAPPGALPIPSPSGQTR